MKFIDLNFYYDPVSELGELIEKNVLYFEHIPILGLSIDKEILSILMEKYDFRGPNIFPPSKTYSYMYTRHYFVQ